VGIFSTSDCDIVLQRNLRAESENVALIKSLLDTTASDVFFTWQMQQDVTDGLIMNFNCWMLSELSSDLVICRSTNPLDLRTSLIISVKSPTLST